MDKKRLIHTITWLLIISLLQIGVGHSAERFPLQLHSAKTQLNRCSVAELNAYRFIHVGNAALYLEKCQQQATIFAQTAKQLRFLYDQAIPANAFQEAAMEYLKINLGAKFRLWQSTFEQFNSHYRDIKAGDYYDLIYHPENGLRMQLNGKEIAMIADRDIALAYLNVWFGKEPFSEDLKNQLLKADN